MSWWWCCCDNAKDPRPCGDVDDCCESVADFGSICTDGVVTDGATVSMTETLDYTFNHNVRSPFGVGNDGDTDTADTPDGFASRNTASGSYTGTLSGFVDVTPGRCFATANGTLTGTVAGSGTFIDAIGSPSPSFPTYSVLNHGDDYAVTTQGGARASSAPSSGGRARARWNAARADRGVQTFRDQFADEPRLPGLGAALVRGIGRGILDAPFTNNGSATDEMYAGGGLYYDFSTSSWRVRAALFNRNLSFLLCLNTTAAASVTVSGAYREKLRIQGSVTARINNPDFGEPDNDDPDRPDWHVYAGNGSDDKVFFAVHELEGTEVAVTHDATIDFSPSINAATVSGCEPGDVLPP